MLTVLVFWASNKKNKILNSKLQNNQAVILITISTKLLAEYSYNENRFLGLDDDSEIPDTCKSAFDVICSRMEERLNYSPTEQVSSL